MHNVRENTMRWVASLSCVMALSVIPGSGVWSNGATQTADYTVRFDATWSAQTHPNDFPPGPHFSGLIGGTHHSGVAFWTEGQLASAGIEAMAETGSKVQLQNEVQSAITAGTALTVISGGGIGTSPGSVEESFTIDLTHPLVTVVSMIAPSPDWFVGVSGLSLMNGGDWVGQLVVQLAPYDSGTDDGVTYTSPNQDSNPAQPITEIVTLPAGNGVPFGTFTFTRTDVPPVPSLATRTVFVLGLLMALTGAAVLRARRSAGT